MPHRAHIFAGDMDKQLRKGGKYSRENKELGEGKQLQKGQTVKAAEPESLLPGSRREGARWVGGGDIPGNKEQKPWGRSAGKSSVLRGSETRTVALFLRWATGQEGPSSEVT